MANKDLSRILDRISEAVDEPTVETFKYSVNSTLVAKEIASSLTELPESIIKKAADNYTSDLYKGMKSYSSSNKNAFKVKLVGSSTSFIALISTTKTSQNIDSFIKTKRRKPLNRLQNFLISKLNSIETESKPSRPDGERIILEDRVNSLLNREDGRTKGSKTLVETRTELTDIVNRLPPAKSSIVNKVLGNYRLNLQTGYDTGTLRKAKLTVELPENTNRANIRSTISKLLREVDFAALKDPINAYDVIDSELQKAGKKVGFKGAKVKNTKHSSSASKITSSNIKTSLINESVSSAIKTKKTRIKDKPVKTNWNSIINIINARLGAEVKSNMGAPRLVNRTGTFAESAKVTGVQVTDRGYPSFSYTYQKSPYQVFDKYYGRRPWNTLARDPNTLIDMSIRNILRDLAIGRFYLRKTR